MADNNNESFLLRLFKSLDLGDVVVAGMILPIVKDLGGKFFGKVGKDIAQKFGLDTSESKKVVEDNILYGKIRFDFTAEEIEDIFSFEQELRASDGGEDKFAALVLYVVRGVAFFKKETTKGGGKNKDGTEKESVKTVDDSLGTDWAKKFLKQLLARPSFEDKVAFLEGENVFALIKKEKKTIDLIKEATEFKDKTVEIGKNFLANASERFSEVGENIDNLTQSFESNGRARYEAAKARRRR